MKNQIVWILVAAVVVVLGATYYFINQNTLSQTAVYQDNSTTAPVANTDTSAIHITIASANAPTFSGTANGTSKVALSFIAISPASFTGAKSHGGADVDVKNGRWTYTAASDFFERGDYKVDAYPTDASGKVESYDNPAASATFSVSASKVDAQLSASPITGAAPLGVSFSASKQGLADFGSDYTVDFGDGTQTSTAKFTCGLQLCSQQHSYAAAGTYTAKFIDATGNVVKMFTITVSPAPAVTYKTINNLALNISFAVPTNWIVQNLSTLALDPVSLNASHDGYNFGVTVSNTANPAQSVYAHPDFATLQAQASGYQQSAGSVDNGASYTKIKNLTVDGYPAVYFATASGKDSFSYKETLWIHGQAKDWFVTFEDTAYAKKYPYEIPIQQAILASVHVTQ